MADLEALRDEFAAAFAAGDDPDPGEWLRRVDAGERQELESLIDRYLMTAPRRSWDADAYEHSLAKVAVERVFESREGVSGSWPELLPHLRNRARIKRADLVKRLAAALDVGSSEADVNRVGVYYNRMEHGALPADGVSATVLSALADLVGTTAATLRAAGAASPGPSAGKGLAFMRLTTSYEAQSPAAPAEGAAAEPDERDRIDELFTGG